MESRKMVLMNLFEGSNGDLENGLVDTVGARVGQIEKEALTYILYQV